MYGRQLADLLDHFPREQVLLLRYKQLVDEPDSHPRPGLRVPRRHARRRSTTSRSDNSRRFVHDRARAPVRSARVIRTGAAVGQFFPPEVWRKVSQPLVDQLQRGGDPAGRG